MALKVTVLGSVSGSYPKGLHSTFLMMYGIRVGWREDETKGSISRDTEARKLKT